MAIGNVVQRAAAIYVYDERGNALTIIAASSGPHDGLKGYTQSTVNVRIGSTIYTYDERGNVIATTFA